MTTEQLNTIDAPIAAYSPVAAGLAELRHRFNGVVFDVSTTKGDKEARGFRKELVTLRTTLEAKRKELKAPALAYAKRIDDEAKAITVEILALEEPIDAQIKAEEARKEAERVAKAEAERKRVANHHERIAGIRGFVGSAFGLVSRGIDALIEDAEAVAIDASFEEFQGQAQTAKEETLAKLREMHAAAVAYEAEQARIKAEQEAEAARMAAERAELERLRAEAAERERVAAAARAEEERKAREARAAEEKAQAEKLAAERAAQAEELRKQREAQEAELRAQREAQAKADAEAAEARRAEEARLAAERAELRRQQEEAEAQRRAAEEAKHAADMKARNAAPAMLAALRHIAQVSTEQVVKKIANEAIKEAE